MSIEALRAAEAEARDNVDLMLDLFRAQLDGATREAEMSEAIDAFAAAVRATLEGETAELVRWANEAYQHRFDEVRLPPDICLGLHAALQPFLARRGR